MNINKCFSFLFLAQIIPNHEAVLALPGRTRSPAEAELVFRVMLPPLGFTSIAIDRPEPSGKRHENLKRLRR